MAAHLADIVNLYVQTLRKAVTVPGTPYMNEPTPTVSTKPENAKVNLVRQGYTDAIVYIIDVAQQRRDKTLTPAQALVPIAQYFSLFGIPHPNNLTLASQFWARSLADISSRVNQAVNYSKAQADIQTGVADSPYLPTVTDVSQLRAGAPIPLSGFRV